MISKTARFGTKSDENHPTTHKQNVTYVCQNTNEITAISQTNQTDLKKLHRFLCTNLYRGFATANKEVLLVLYV